MPDPIRLTWYVKAQHTQTFTPDEFAEWLEDLRIDADPTDLDAVYNALDSGGWRVEEALFERADNRTWLDFSEAEISDLQPEPESKAARR